MAISPPGDIVNDVMRAASPEKVSAARAQLQRISQSAAAGVGPGFEVASPGASRQAEATDKAKSLQKFEAMVLGQFFQQMMPQNSESVYGEGLSGDIWKSITAQHLGDSVAQSGGIGIANRLLADQYKVGDKLVTIGPVSEGPAKEKLDTQNGLQRAMLDELQRQATQTLYDKAGQAKSVAK